MAGRPYTAETLIEYRFRFHKCPKKGLFMEGFMEKDGLFLIEKNRLKALGEVAGSFDTRLNNDVRRVLVSLGSHLVVGPA